MRCDYCQGSKRASSAARCGPRRDMMRVSTRRDIAIVARAETKTCSHSMSGEKKRSDVRSPRTKATRGMPIRTAVNTAFVHIETSSERDNEDAQREAGERSERRFCMSPQHTTLTSARQVNARAVGRA